MLALPADFLGQIYRGPSKSGPEAAFHEEDSERSGKHVLMFAAAAQGLPPKTKRYKTTQPGTSASLLT